MRGYLGNQARNRQKGHRRGGGGPRHGQEGLPVDDHIMEGTDADIIPPEELLPISPEVPAEQKRIVVSIAQQTLTAYEGERVVYYHRISSGRQALGTAERASGAARQATLDQLVQQLEADKRGSCDQKKVEDLQKAARDLRSPVVS